MNRTRIGLGIVLADFAALNAYVVYRYGYLGFFDLVFANAATIALFVDLSIALGLVAVWMWRDARATGRAFAPYAVVTALFGSIGPLLYLLVSPPARTVPTGHLGATRIEPATIGR